jgi:hyperosmotically inducible periplasmic protein
VVTPNAREVTHDKESAKSAADNTERNERDRDTNALTPMDQGESEADRKVTQDVRQSVIGQDSLSTNAKNVRIVTNQGVVTLRRPVDSAEEKATIARLAQGVAGVTRIDNQLEVTQK